MRKDLLKKTLRFLDLPEDMDPMVPRIKELGESRALVTGKMGRWAYGE